MTGIYTSGGNYVAPTASKIMADILPYLGMLEPVAFMISPALTSARLASSADMLVTFGTMQREARACGMQMIRMRKVQGA